MLQNNYGRLAIVSVFVIIAIILMMAPGMHTKPSNEDQLNFTSMPKDRPVQKNLAEPAGSNTVTTKQEASSQVNERLVSPEDQLLDSWGMRKVENSENQSVTDPETVSESENRSRQIRIPPAEEVKPKVDLEEVKPQAVPEQKQESSAESSKKNEVKNEPSIKIGSKCFTYPQKATPLGKEDCEASKEILGINSCPAEGVTDQWAGAVKLCGTVNAMPTMDDLFELAGLVYRGSVFKLPDNIKKNYKAYGTYDPTSTASDNLNFKDVIYLPEKAKGFGLPETPGYSVWGKVEMNTSDALALTFAEGVVKYTSVTPRTSENFYTICRVPCK